MAIVGGFGVGMKGVNSAIVFLASTFREELPYWVGAGLVCRLDYVFSMRFVGLHFTLCILFKMEPFLKLF